MTDSPACDYHIHTKYLGCGDSTMEVAAIVQECARLGVRSLAITDHLNSFEKLELHRPIKRDIESLGPGIEVYFGAELNFIDADGDFPYNSEIKEKYGFQFAIGGIHLPYLEGDYDVQKLVAIQHRHHLKTCEDPRVDVLVHPYWFGKKIFERNGWPWFDSMQAVPESCARELGQAAKETGTAIEINGGANLANPGYSDRYVREYMEYLAIIAEEGACFALSSDAHTIGRLKDTQAAWRAAEQLALTPDRIWRPKCEPMVRA